MTDERKDERNRLSTKDIASAAAERRARDLDARQSATPPPSAAAKATAEPVAATRRVVDESAHESLFDDNEAHGFRSRWEAIQTGFVDEPRAAVQEADALVAQVVTRLAEVFNQEKTTLEHQWDRGDNISTEDLRLALKRYRAFFDRLLSV